MSTVGIVLPPLSLWAQNQVTALFQAISADDFNAAFEGFIAAHVDSIVVNGQTLTRDQFKKTIQSTKGLEAGATVNYLGSVEVQKSAETGEKSGEVGLFLKASVAEKIKVFGADRTLTVIISFNLNIVQDPSIKPPKIPHGYYDPRRVSSLTAVFTSQADPILPPGPGIATQD